MKTNDFNKMIQTILTEQVRNVIVESINEGKKEVYHIKCNGEPVDSFNSMKEAETHLNIYKKNHPGKQFIIEKSVYDSDSDMIDKLDEMGQQLEEKETQNMEKNSIKVKSLAEAILHAKENGKKTIKINNESYNVDEYWKLLQEEEGVGEDEECMECGEMKETDLPEGKVCENCGKEVCECGDMKETDIPEGFDEYVKKMGTDMKSLKKDRIVKEPKTVEESSKKKLRLKESEFIELINKMVTEAMKGQPGLPGIPGVTVTKKAQEASKKDGDSNMSDVEKKMKDYLSFDGNDNPEFPNQIGGDKMAVNNTEEQDETVEDNRGRMMIDLNYDVEPSERFKERVDAALNGDSKMGNPTDAANAIPSKLGKKIKKDGEKSQKLKKEEPLYHKEPAPITTVKESTTDNSLVNEEIEKIKKLSFYDKKTQ